MDPRFDTSKDPRFKHAPRNVRHVKVDKRFARMFDDKDFVETAKVDAQGRRLKRNSAKDRLREFYELANPDGANAPPAAPAARPGKAAADKAKALAPSATQTAPKRKGLRRKGTATAMDDEVCGQGDDGDDESAAGGSAGSAESSEESSDDEEDLVYEDPDDCWDQLEDNVPKGDATARFAIMGCDWDHASAADVLAMLRTFLESSEANKGSGALRAASVNRVVIYPSDYGIEQMAKESTSGPSMDGATPGKDAGLEEATTEEVEKKQQEALRRYQLQRTKYYYALATCDSVNTAAWLYDQLDGLEVDGMCAGPIDLRFVPDDIVFPHAPTSEASEVPQRYQGPAQRDSCVGHSKVKCTWDEAPARRKKDLMKKSFSPNELRDADLEVYLASSSEDEAGSGAEALKSLVRGADGEDLDNEDDSDEGSEQGSEQPEMGDMEATFSIKAEELEEKLTAKAKQEEKKTGRKAKKLESDQPKSVWEQYLEKRKEKRRSNRETAKAQRTARKNGEVAAATEDGAPNDVSGEADLALLAMDDEDGDKGFNVRGRLGRGSVKRENDASKEGFQVDVNDPRISNVFSSADFDIDPTNPEYRPSKGMEEVLRKKRRRKASGSVQKLPEERLGAGVAAAAEAVGPARSVAAAPVRGGGGNASVGGLQLFAPRRGSEAPAAAATTGAAPGKKKKMRNKDRPCS